MLKKRIIITLTFFDGVLFRTKNFKPDYRYTKNFIDLWSIDELILVDISKKKNPNKFLEIINFFKENCFVPITVGGGINTEEYADILFRNGCEKILLGSNSIINQTLLNRLSLKYGSQAILQSINFKKKNNEYYATSNNGKNIIQEDSLKIIKNLIKNGAGEILINNVDNDGSLLGYDIKLIKHISDNVNIPLLALGGAGNWEHILELFKKTDVSGACTQNIYHFTEESIKSAKNFLKSFNINVRV